MGGIPQQYLNIDRNFRKIAFLHFLLCCPFMPIGFVDIGNVLLDILWYLFRCYPLPKYVGMPPEVCTLNFTNICSHWYHYILAKKCIKNLCISTKVCNKNILMRYICNFCMKLPKISLHFNQFLSNYLAKLYDILSRIELRNYMSFNVLSSNKYSILTILESLKVLNNFIWFIFERPSIIK